MTFELTDTRALRRLREWIAEDRAGRSASRLAELLDVAQPSVSQWLNGRSRPKDHMRLAVQALTGGHVTVGDWLTREERRMIARVKPLRAGTAA